MIPVSQDQVIRKTRVIFIDLIRAFAVFMMVQGHTIDALLSNEYRTGMHPIFNIWNFFRGLNAPIFIFTSGAAFTYLFLQKGLPFNENPRVSKGFKRFMLLLFLGYLIHIPTIFPSEYSKISTGQWLTFFKVDALQIIGVGILSIIIVLYVVEKLKLNPYYTFLFLSIFIALISHYTLKIEWVNFLPLPIALYFYYGPQNPDAVYTLFPIFPWLSYIFAGAFLGVFLAKHPKVYKTKWFGIKIILWGLILILSSLVSIMIENNVKGYNTFWENPFLIFNRIGIVLVFSGIITLLTLRIDKIPRIVVLAGQNTLLIYIVHLMLVYGSPINLGLSYLFYRKLGPIEAVLFAIIVLFLMGLMVKILDIIKPKYKELKTKFFTNVKNKISK